SDFHRTGERIIDFHNDQQPGKDQDRQSACHQRLSAQVIGTEKEGEPDGQKGAAEKHHPDNCANMTFRKIPRDVHENARDYARESQELNYSARALGHDTAFTPSYAQSNPNAGQCRLIGSVIRAAHRDRTAWLGWEDSNSEMSTQIIPLKDRTDLRE